MLIIAIGLSMDAFAVSVAKGLSVSSIRPRHSLCVGGWFGGFQAIMPLIGFYLGITFSKFVSSVDHWIAFVLLGAIGINMIRESFEKEEIEEKSSQFTYRILFAESIATAIDALSSGIVLPEFPVSPLISCIVICVITSIICIIAHSLGKKIALLLKDKATLCGGIILILLGVKTVLEHMGFM